MISNLLKSRPAPFDCLAAAWRAAGAQTLQIWDGVRLVAAWPPDAVEIQPGLRATIDTPAHHPSELRVSGVYGREAQARLRGDAALISQLAFSESELESLTADLINAQDQLLAICNLAQTSRSWLNAEKVLQTSVDEIYKLLQRGSRRYLPTMSVFAVYAAQTEILQAQFPEAGLEPEILTSLLQRMQKDDGELQLTSAASLDGFAADIGGIFLIPVRIRGSILAGIGLVTSAKVQPSSAVLKLLRTLAEQVGAQLENILLHEESLAQAHTHTELALAREVQLHLLPQRPPQIPGLDLYAISRPALLVGGDFYDFVAAPDRPFFFAVGDVSTKGMSAALLMSMTFALFHNAAKYLPEPSPASVLRRANHDLYSNFTEVGMFATAFAGFYDPQTKLLTFANAGHSPVIYCPYRKSARLLESDGPAIGVLPESLSANHLLDLAPGDVLVVATDGFNETQAVGGNMFGLDRLLQTVESHADQSAREIAEGLFAAVEAFGESHVQDDDRTLVVVKRVDP